MYDRNSPSERHRIGASYLRPAGADGERPVVVKPIGYGGGRGMPAEHALLPALGYAVFVIDTVVRAGRRPPAPPATTEGRNAAGPKTPR